jgi:non-ribosomal peptide synthetase component E (peptide arylation enzyme)
VIGFAQLSAGTKASRIDEIMRFLCNRLADYKVPDRLIQLQRIPRNALGKMDRSALPAMI